MTETSYFKATVSEQSTIKPKRAVSFLTSKPSSSSSMAGSGSLQNWKLLNSSPSVSFGVFFSVSVCWTFGLSAGFWRHKHTVRKRSWLHAGLTADTSVRLSPWKESGTRRRSSESRGGAACSGCSPGSENNQRSLSLSQCGVKLLHVCCTEPRIE